MNSLKRYRNTSLQPSLFNSITRRVSGRTYLLSPMTSSLILTKGTGNPTLTRATTAYTVDGKGLKQAMPSGAARFPGLRVVRNLLTATEFVNGLADVLLKTTDISATTLTGYGGALQLKKSTITSFAYKAYVTVIGRTYIFSVDIQMGDLSVPRPGTSISNANIDFCFVLHSDLNITGYIGKSYLGNNIYRFFCKSTAPNAYQNFGIIAYTGNSGKTFKATAFALYDVTNQANQVAREYISSGVLSTPYHGLGADGIKAFDYENPFTVDGNGVVTEGAHIPITGTKGMMFEPTSTNKCTCYGVPRADALGSNLLSTAQSQMDSGWTTSGESTVSGGVGRILSTGAYSHITPTGPVLVAGKYYTWTYTVSGSPSGVLQTQDLDILPTAVGINTVRILALSNSAVIFKRGAPCDITIDTVSVQENLDYPGTKAYHDGTAFQNPITGMTLSGSDTLGSEMLTNGGFDSNTTGWYTDASTTLASVAGGPSGNCLEITRVSGTSQSAAFLSITTVVGQRYRATVYVKSGTSGDEAVRLYVANIAYSTIAQINTTTSSTWTLVTLEFNATETTTRLYLSKMTATAGTMLFDTASFKTITYPAVLSIVTDQTAIDAAIAAEIAKGQSAWDGALLTALELSRDNGYKVYKLDNSGGASICYIRSGSTGNVNAHSGLTIIRGTGTCKMADLNTGTWVNTFSLSDQWNNKKWDNIVPSITTAAIQLVVYAGAVAYFLAPTLEELPFATSLNPSAGAASTRNADIFSYPVAGNLPNTGRRHIKLNWTPKAVIAGRDVVLAYTAQDASNFIKVASNGVIIYFQKRVAGVDEFVCYTITPVAGTTYAIDAWFNSDHTMGLKINGVSAGSGLGIEILTTAQAACDSGWGVIGESTANTGVLRILSSVGASSYVYINNAHTSYKIYQTQYTVASGPSGSIKDLASNNVLPGSVGLNTSINIAPSIAFGFSRVAACDITLDNVSLKEIFNSSTTLTPVLGTNLFIGSDGTTAINGQIKDFEIRS